MDKKRFHIRVSGRVQGVGYRYFTVDIARSLELSGWVRNTDEGNVELEVQGSSDSIELFIEHLHKGPTLAHVTEVKKNEIPLCDNEQGFFIR